MLPMVPITTRAFFLLALWSVQGSIVQAGLENPPTLESMVGERLEFRLRWGVIPAADATLEVLPGDQPSKIKFRAFAKTLSYVGMFYPVRETIESTVALPGAKVERYSKQGRQGREKSRDQEVVFDLENGTAQLRRNEDLREPIEIPPDVQDPLSCFYVFRTLPVPDDGAVNLKVSDGKKVVDGVVKLVGRETVQTPAGTFEAAIIEPELEGLGGIFRKSPGARILIWITDDDRRIPVKMQSEVSIGHFTAVLTKMVTGEQSATEELAAESEETASEAGEMASESVDNHR